MTLVVPAILYYTNIGYARCAIQTQMMPVLADLVSGRQPEMGVCQQSRQLYDHDDNYYFSDDVYHQDDGNPLKDADPPWGYQGVSQSVVETSEVVSTA